MTVRPQRTEPLTIALAVGSILATVLVAVVFVGLAMRDHSCTREPQKYTYNGQTHVAYQVVCS
jgi:hypothetical protein